jgi:hypothetical protein
MIVDRMIMISVRLAQAQWAQYLLDRERIPIQYGVLDESTPRASYPARKDNEVSLLAVVIRWLDKLAALLDQ